MTSNTDWEKEWEESEVCKRIAGLESFAIAHGWTGFQGENVPDFIRTQISRAEKRGQEKAVEKLEEEPVYEELLINTGSIFNVRLITSDLLEQTKNL